MTDAPNVLTQGIYTDISAARYHADPAPEPSLSSSIAKTIVTKTPKAAWLQHPRLNPDFKPEHDSAFDLGSAVHDGLASNGANLSLVDGYADWRSSAAQAMREAERAKGLVPLLRHQVEQVSAIVTRVKEQTHRAGIAFGLQEAVLLAHDRGVWLRAMLDSFAEPWVNDFKVSKINLADDVALGRYIVNMSYDLRAWHYVHVAGLVLPSLAGRLKYRWIFVEEEAPHGVRIVEADATFLEMGRRKGEHAIGLWKWNIESGQWPHLEHLPRTVPYPGYAENQWLERESADGFVTGPLATLKAMEDGK